MNAHINIETPTKTAYVKGLNGLRAIAAMVLLWGHIPQDSFAQWEISSLPLPVCCAYVFFVLSGFLAGYLLKEKIILVDYYKKKAKRILPLYYSYILITIIFYLVIGRGNDIINKDLWYYLCLIPNIASAIIQWLFHWFTYGLLAHYYCFISFSL